MLDSQLGMALKEHWGLAAWVSAGMMAQTVLTLVQPWPVQALIDHVVQMVGHVQGSGDKTGLLEFIVASTKGFLHTGTLAFVFRGIALLLAIYLMNAVLIYFQSISLVQLGQRVVLRIRENLFAQAIALPHSFFEKARTGDLTSRISTDTADVQDVLESMITIFVRSLPTIIGILAVSFVLDWVYALTLFLVVPVVFWVNYFFTRLTREEIRRQRRIEGNMASTVQEAFYHHKAIATLSMEQDLVADFLESSQRSASHGEKAGRFQGVLSASLDFLIGATSVFVLFVGILRIVHGCLTVGQLMVFLSYLNSLFKPIREISKFTGRIAKSSAALERIEEIARLNPMEIGATELPGSVEAPPFRGDIRFDAVTFGYDPHQPVLRDFDLRIEAGRKVALVGDSGSGKSTAVHLLMRLYDPLHGQVRIDGRDIRSFKLASLRSQMAIVLQDSYIFRTTIADNIAVSKPGASRSEIMRAAAAAQAEEFIRELPDGYDSQVGESGAGLSGGQKRRLAIARAFLRNAPIVLLDEPTAGLDAASEQKVTEAVNRLGRGKTTVIVTHQLSTVTDADLIVVLSGGRIVEKGTHRELLEKGEHYRYLWDMQQQETTVSTRA
ncbi:MAG: ABC transporter ATP-binding protein [Syntrophobacteraceae bacterium]